MLLSSDTTAVTCDGNNALYEGAEFQWKEKESVVVLRSLGTSMATLHNNWDEIGFMFNSLFSVVLGNLILTFGSYLWTLIKHSNLII